MVNRLGIMGFLFTKLLPESRHRAFVCLWAGSFFGALYGRMVGEKFFKYPGSMWVGGPPPFFPTPEAGESNMKIVFPEDGHGFALRQPI
jgi:hypothetical protein